MSVTVRAKLPKGDTNGLADLEASLAANPNQQILVVGFVRPDTIEERPHDDENPRLVKTVLLHVEALDGDAAARAEKALRDVYAKRTGRTQLPFEVDPEKGD
jgi:hypothetical protein